MRSSSISSPFSWLSLTVYLAGCGGTPSVADLDHAKICQIDFTGNTVDHAEVSACATVADWSDTDAGTDAGEFALSIDTRSASFGRLAATIAIGTSPTVGELSSENGQSWNALAIFSTSDCTFQGGNTSVPNGSYSLMLTSLDWANMTAKGTLAIVAYVHAPSATDCGYGDIDDISVNF